MPVNNSGAVYNWYVHQLMDKSTDDLNAIVDEWAKKPLGQKVLAHLNIFADQEMKLKAAKDLIATREDPNCDVAKNINPKIAGWRRERGEPGAA